MPADTATGPGTAANGAAPVGCCSAFYEQDWVRGLAEDSFHPGGEDLTRRTVAAMALPSNAALLDLGCGTGTTALMLAGEGDLAVAGVDMSASNIERALARTRATPGIDSRRLRFVCADAHELPFEDGEFEGILAECVFSLLADKPAALAELRRVLKPGGRIGLTDMAVHGTLPADIAEVIAPWTCLVDALDQGRYVAAFEMAGFRVLDVGDESRGLTTLIRNLKRKLLLLGAGTLFANGSSSSPDLAIIRHWLDRFQVEVDKGSIRYLGFVLAA